MDRSSSWKDPIKAYIKDDTLRPEEDDSSKAYRREEWFILFEDVLYKQSYACHLLRCVTLKDGQKILEEIYEGVCSSHIRG